MIHHNQALGRRKCIHTIEKENSYHGPFSMPFRVPCAPKLLFIFPYPVQAYCEQTPIPHIYTMAAVTTTTAAEEVDIPSLPEAASPPPATPQLTPTQLEEEISIINLDLSAGDTTAADEAVSSSPLPLTNLDLEEGAAGATAARSSRASILRIPAFLRAAGSSTNTLASQPPPYDSSPPPPQYAGAAESPPPYLSLYVPLIIVPSGRLAVRRDRCLLISGVGLVVVLAVLGFVTYWGGKNDEKKS
ncbi:hypothetical protein FN846DRAFT_629664 [Sphaerosporella brunnea]|uniref:Uncharacterized protein n=1 Tax=Sphaerosporella brunnea TaxID=1250544 RepID=A0A5J5F0X6_9PEZI|nr:hypothetical protein FN846DRAFT_629664 [Sphaerosporella brunnea]